ncbi:PREDICTED: atherin-like [Sturnus vulgaris]|uniref:atherin-like n=1 Tax=Sturnus vulgaris TaxID=9172 RepID=UPI00071A0E25|nr:PREDICTED: atherin-like [Sturnus vulgaris]
MPRPRIRRPSSLTAGSQSPGRQEGGHRPPSTSAQAREPARSPESAGQGSGTLWAGPAAGTTGAPSRTARPCRHGPCGQAQEPAAATPPPQHRGPGGGRAWWGQRHTPPPPCTDRRADGRTHLSPAAIPCRCRHRPDPPPPRHSRTPSPAAAAVAAAAAAFRFLCPAPPRIPPSAAGATGEASLAGERFPSLLLRLWP